MTDAKKTEEVVLKDCARCGDEVEHVSSNGVCKKCCEKEKELNGKFVDGINKMFA